MKHFSDEKEKVRLEMFIDAILAIIITILVLEFKVPEERFSSDIEISSFINHLLPSVFSYIISFALIISLWINHHEIFRHIRGSNIQFVMLNFFFILFVSPIPFTTALAGRNYESAYAVALVGTNYFLMNVCFAIMWIYITAKKILPPDVLNSRSYKRNLIISSVAGILL